MEHRSAVIVRIALLAGIVAVSSSLLVAQRTNRPQAFTLDDEMAMRSIIDVRIAPNGQRVAYVVSTPSLTKNEHDAALFVVSSRGGPAEQIGTDVHIFNPTVPRPQLRWSPNGTSVSVIGLSANGPQVFAIPLSRGKARQVTTAPEGVFGYEWSPDGTTLAYLTRDPMSADEERQRQDKSFVIHADAPDRPTRLMVQPANQSDSAAAGITRTLTPASHYVTGFSWSPDGRTLAYSAAPRTGFSAPYRRGFTRRRAVPSPSPMASRLCQSGHRGPLSIGPG